MALSFKKIISESENVDSLEDLFFESDAQETFSLETNSFNAFKDPLLILPDQNGGSEGEDTDDCILDLDIECTDLDKEWECDINDSFEFDTLNIEDFDTYHSNSSSINNIACDHSYLDNTHVVTYKQSSNNLFNNSTSTRRQSSRIENQTRKKIAEQIQRENIRLSMEAQFLNNKMYQKKRKRKSTILTERGINPEIPTDLDQNNAEEDIMDNMETLSDDDPNKVWCLCRKPYGERFMICCDNCLEWYHGDCVGVTEQEGTRMDEFICPLCETNLCATVIPNMSDETSNTDNVEDDDHELLEEVPDNTLSTKCSEPTKLNSNIFQLMKHAQDSEADKPIIETLTLNLTSLSTRTSVCLNQICKTLVDPKKSLYCSTNCINKYIKMVIKNNLCEKTKQYGLPKGPKLAKMTRFVLAQPATDTIQDEFDAPTEDTLKEFLINYPTYKVYQSTKPKKTKEYLEKSKKFLELVNRDPSKQIKVVKHFATLFKKVMSVKSFNLEFRNIWQICVKIEEGLFENCDKLINEKYLSKVKEFSESLKSHMNERLFMDILHNKLSVTNLLSMTKEQLSARSKIIILEEQLPISSDKSDLFKRSNITFQSSISLLSDTTHLHNRHLYDINCKVCNGAQKLPLDNKQKDKESILSLEETVSSCTDLSNSKKICSPSNNDEDAVTSSVETPDLVVDMEICSPSSEIDESESKINIDDNNVHSSSAEHVKSTENKNIIKPFKRKLTSLWEGTLTYKEVGSVVCKSYLVTRIFLNKDNEKVKLHDKDIDVRELLHVSSSVSTEIIISGRSQLSEIQKYLHRLRKHSNKEFLVMRLHPSNLDEGGKIYQSMFEFLHGRERCGVINDKCMGVKDCFVYPLNAHVKIPSIFLPFIGPGLEKRRPHLLLLILVRTPLSQIKYQPISPKYDYDDDFVKKHGINLDKYCLPNQTVPFCASPIINCNEEVRWVINTKSTDDKNNPNQVKNPTDITNSKEITEKCIIEAGIVAQENLETSNVEEVKNTKKETKNLTKSHVNINVKLKSGSFEKIVPAANTKDSISDIPDLKLCDIPLPDTMPEVVKKISVNTKITPKSEVPCVSVVNDLSLRPTPFVYRSSIQQNKKENPNESNSSVEDTNCNDVILSNPFISGITKENVIQDASDKNLCEDLDLRFNLSDNKPEEPSVEIHSDVTSQRLFLKRKKSSRLYTFYDSENKRLKYFFNPFSPNNDLISSNKEMLPLISDSKVNVHCLPRNASVFSPKDIIYKT